jgi:DNA-binding transcriptional LysR family regulator
MDQIERMRCFTRVVESGSFSAAARDLGLTQPSVSKAIRALEKRLGARLLQRTTRSLRITEEGASYYGSCLRILAELDEAEGALRSGRVELRGLLRVTCARDYGQAFLAPLALRFLAAHPEVSVDLVLDDRRIDLVGEGIDVGIRLGALDDSTLRARRLGHFSRLAVAAPDYLERYGRPSSPAGLEAHRCIVQTTLSWGGRWSFAERSSGRTVTSRVSGRLRAGSNLVIRDSAVAGFGVAILPEWLVSEDIARGRLERILPGFEAAGIEVHAVHPSGDFLPRKTRTFLDFLREEWPAATSPGAPPPG